MDFTAGSFVVNFNTTVGRYLQDENVFHYRGSLTTPSCSEIVNWFVVQKVFPIRPSQLQAIKLQLNDDEPNSRPVQDLNQRSIFYITPSCNLDFTFEVTKRMQLSSGKMQAAVLLMLLAFVFFL
ncbi:MAG: carbonic anhydrase family protein [Actinobacteria bacterium]|nr:carbonic anhydrase family protein [Actinomycetota bacterium]